MQVLIRPRLSPYVSSPRKTTISEAITIFYEIFYGAHMIRPRSQVQDLAFCIRTRSAAVSMVTAAKS